MRRFLVLILALVTIPSCARTGQYPPEEVLRRAAQAVTAIESADFTLSGSADREKGSSVSWNARGTLGQGGKQIQFSADISGVLRDEQEHQFHARIDVTVMGENEVYLRIQQAQVDPPHPMFNQELLAAVSSKWFRLPSEGTVGATDTPDPSLLRAQAQVVKVTADKGVSTHMGHDVYSYEVAIDSQKFLNFLKATAEAKKENFDAEAAEQLLQMLANMKGNLLINAESFSVEKFSWSSTSEEESALHLSLTMELSNYNKAPPITPPQGAVPFDFGPLAPSTTSAEGALPFLP